MPGSSDFYSTWSRHFNGTEIQFFQIGVSPSFPATMGISIIGGRDFREDDLNSSKDLCIFNRTAGDLYGISPGDIGNNLEVIGISDDIRFASFRKEVTPTALVLNRNNRFSYAVIRVKAGFGLKPVRAEIEKCLKKFSPEYELEVYFYDQVLEHTYRREQRTGKLVSLQSSEYVSSSASLSALSSSGAGSKASHTISRSTGGSFPPCSLPSLR